MTEAELLFSEILNCDRAALYRDRRLILDRDKSRLASLALKRRIKGEPVQYILGKTEFMGLEFKVTPDVLIPRPETEILVETAIRYQAIGHRPEAIDHRLKTEVKILDLGTGSGCIAVSLAKFLPQAKIFAVDISKSAIEVAKINAQINEVENRIKFCHSDFFATYDLQLTTYDFIISNPPYIVTLEIAKLQPEIQYEPRIALDGGSDGLDFYRRLAKEAWLYLKEEGLLIMEIGYKQKSRIENIFQKSGNFEIIEVVKDYGNIDRVMIGRKLNSKP